MLNFIKGDMFDVDADIRINTVNCVGVMGTGVALAFKKKYPEMFFDYHAACIDGKVRPGEMYIWHGRNNQWIINFPTKRHWREKSRYEDISSGLKALYNYLREFPGVKVALPALGCGNGGLDWKRVAPMIVESLKDLDAEIFVFEPSDSLILGKKISDRLNDEASMELELMGFKPFDLPFEFNNKNEIQVKIKGNSELLVNQWIALWTSKDIREREFFALKSIAEQMGQLSSSSTVALIYQNSASEEIAEIFLKNGLAVVLLLAFSPRVKKRIGLTTNEDNKITYAILSAAHTKNLKGGNVSYFIEELLKGGAYALLLSDPNPKNNGKSVLNSASKIPCFYVRYTTHSNEVVHQLESDGFRSIGRRPDTGEPNLLPIITAQNAESGVSTVLSDKADQITAFVSPMQLRKIAEIIENNADNSTGVYLSIVLDSISSEIRDPISQIFKFK